MDNITMRETINTIKNSYLVDRTIVYVIPSVLRVGYIPIYYSFPYTGVLKDLRVSIGNEGNLVCKIYMLTEDEFTGDEEGTLINQVSIDGVKVLVSELNGAVEKNNYFKILVEEGTDARDVSFQINISVKELI